MSKFSDDVKLLADLQGLISKFEKQANPPPFSGAVMGAISPVLKAAMPAAQAAAREQVDILVRAKTRPEELMEGSENHV